MKPIGKYNLCKGISSLLTIGTPLVTLLCTSDFFVESPSRSISAAGVFAILIATLFFKDKVAENFKCPSAFVISLITFGVIVVIKNIIEPVEIICITTMIATGIDELTFKRIYKETEALIPKEAQSFKHFGYLFISSSKLQELKSNGEQDS